MNATHDVNFTPLEGFVLCLPPGARKTNGGIVIPETAQAEGEPVKMKVVKVGCGEVSEYGFRREIPVEPGEVAFFIFPRYSVGAEITLDGQKYFIAQAKWICGVESAS